MRLYNKFLTGVGITAAIFIVIILLLSNSILLSDYSNIEKNSIIRDVERVNNTINSEVENISAFVKDYSTWDDSYVFSNNQNEEFISSNFRSYASSFRKFRVNFMIYTDKEGKVILSKGFNLNTDKEGLLSQNIENEILLKVKQISIMKQSKSIAGVIEINNTPTILVTEPITTSDGMKKSGGMIISGRYLDANQISQIGSSLRVRLSIEKNNYNLKSDKVIKWDNNVRVVNINKKSSEGHKILLDIENKPYYDIKINVIREIYGQAIKSITYFVIIIILLSFIFFGIALIYLNKVVASRIMKMNKIIHTISDTKDLTIKMKSHGNDEIATLATGFNDMLDELTKSSDKIEIGKNRYYSLITNMMNCFSYNKILFNEEGIPIDFIILEGNSALFEYMELERENIIGKKMSVFMGDDKLTMNILNTFSEVAMSGVQRKIDEVYFENAKRWLTATAYSIEEGYFALMFSDITEKKNIERENLELANRDVLTGLPNRKLIMENINVTIDKRKNDGGKFAILFIDLDNFKRVNDSLGHYVGDILIQKVGARFKNTISSAEVVSRIGGDEFIILQDNINSDGEAESLAIRIKNVLKESFVYMGNELYTTASIGISIYPSDGEDISSLMKNSDIAMYEAKKNGGNCYRVYSGNMNKCGLTNLILENNLYRALERKEMILYYQAITNVQNKRIIGFEALIRWNRDDKIIPPSDFIPMAENNGYIIELGEWVIREACRQCSEWRNAGMEIYVTANITFKQLEQTDFVDIVSNALVETKMDPKYLVLEITENALMQNVDLTIKTLNKIKNLGVSIALDDFGTGYSSLSYVNRLPVDFLKIDRSLVMDIAVNTQNIAIIKAIIAMADSLNIKVVVEGVEEIEQFIILQKLNCYSIQGYLISKPIPAYDIKNLMERKINLP